MAGVNPAQCPNGGVLTGQAAVATTVEGGSAMWAPEAGVLRLGADRSADGCRKRVTSQAARLRDKPGKSVKGPSFTLLLAEGQDWVGDGQQLVPFRR